MGNAGFGPRWGAPRSDISLGINGQWDGGWSNTFIGWFTNAAGKDDTPISNTYE